MLKHNPDIVIIYVGVNDVWHKLPAYRYDFNKFGRFYEALVNKITGCRYNLLYTRGDR